MLGSNLRLPAVMGLLALGLTMRPVEAVDNEPPTCEHGGPYECVPQHSVEFDGRGSYDPDGVIVSYLWYFGDGHTATGALVPHRYEVVGSFTVALLVTDDDDNFSVCETIARIVEPCPGNCPPVCDAGGPYYGMTGVPIQFDGLGSLPVIPCIPLVYFGWTFGDGATALGPQPLHTYTTPGSFYVMLTIMDSDGAASSCFSQAVVAEPSGVDPTTWGRIKNTVLE